MVQDYHLFLVPKMLRDLRPDVRIGHFTHTPWVNPEYFSALPDDIAAALIEGMLGADVLGFHTERWAELFRDCARSIAGVEADGVRVFPLGVDADEMDKLGHRRSVDSALRVLNGIVGDRLLIGRVDRTELSKNVYRGLLAYRQLLRTHPEWHGKVVHAVYNNPSREDLPAYREYTARIERLAEEIDDEFSTEDWTPLIAEIADDYPAALAVLRRSDVVFVNSVRDGMNLVVLEGLVLSEHDPAVVLSREAGAAEVLGHDALMVNPFDVVGMADALHRALQLSRDERATRAARMRDAAVRLPPTAWFQAQLDAVGESNGRDRTG
jgi:trehalose 6-phosphate synthase